MIFHVQRQDKNEPADCFVAVVRYPDFVYAHTGL